MVELNEYPVVCRFIPDWYETLKEFHNNCNVFFAIGVKGEKLNFIRDVYKSYSSKHYPGIIDNPVSISIDIAHGDSVIGHSIAQKARSLDYIGSIMSGTVCTPEGACRAIDSGCTHIRVGVGPGSVCTTRLMTGCGLPNLSAVHNIYKSIQTRYGPNHNIKIIADGGIKHPGDAVKYLAAGADGVMVGSVLARCPESPGWKENQFGSRKRYRGQASKEFQEELLGRTPHCAEGAVGQFIEPGESCEDIVNKFRGGLKSAISYLGARSIDEINPENVTFVKLTASGFHEGTPHGTY
jgi:IMP dehydrogenase